MSFLLGLFGLLTIFAGGFLSLGLLSGDLIGIGGAVLWTGGWLMFGASVIVERQGDILKLTRDIAEKKPEQASPPA